jgi:hypothetical protein
MRYNAVFAPTSRSNLPLSLEMLRQVWSTEVVSLATCSYFAKAQNSQAFDACLNRPIPVSVIATSVRPVS